MFADCFSRHSVAVAFFSFVFSLRPSANYQIWFGSRVVFLGLSTFFHLRLASFHLQSDTKFAEEL